MDWKIFGTTFITIFIAELGDKTQFAAIAASSQSKSTFSVLIAVILALAVAGTIGVAFGSILGRLINPEYIRYVAGTLFILVGIWVLVGK